MSHHSNHSYAKLLYHFVWSTDERKPLIIPEIKNQLYAFIGEITARRDWPLYAIGGIENHLHILLQLNVKSNLPDVVARIKTNSSHFVRGLGYKDFTWQRGYGVFTVDTSSIPRLKNYIHNQETHHQSMRYEKELAMMLKRYQVL